MKHLSEHDVAQARARWPGVSLESAQLNEIWTRLSDSTDGPELDCLPDLFLACAVLRQDAAALEHLSRLVSSLLPRLTGFGLGSAQLTTLAQDTLSSVATEGLLKHYGGRGSLEGWLLRVMSRRALRLQEVSAAKVELDDVLLGSLKTESEPELELIRERFRGAFSSAFRAAVANLDSRQRNLLRQHHLDQLSLDELGLMYRVHRSTAARWLADARAALLEGTRDEISRHLGIGRLEVDSLMRVVRSRLDVSAGVFLSNAGARGGLE